MTFSLSHRRIRKNLISTPETNLSSPTPIRKRKLVLILAIALLASSWTTALLPTTTASAKSYDEMSPRERALSWSYLKTLERCVDRGKYRDGGLNDRINDASAKSYRFFTTSDTGVGFILADRSLGAGHFLKESGIPEVVNNDRNNHVACGVDEGSTTWLKNALTLWGWENPIDFLCGSSTKEGIGAARTEGADCRNGTTPFTPFNKDNVLRVIQSEVYSGKAAEMGSAGEYVYNLGVFYQACMGGLKTAAQGNVNPNDSRFYPKVKVVQPDGSISETNYYGTVQGDQSIDYKPRETSTCPELVARINGGSGAIDYARWIRDNPGQDSSADDDADSTIESTPSCAIEGIGWVVCPVMTFMGGVGDAAYGLVSNFLDVNSKIMDTSSGTFTAWQAFRDIANAAFVLVFLVVIYSQITNAGIGSYGIKKMLPRLVIGAILVNASFFICQIMVDVTQILGASLSEFLKNIPAGAGSEAATELSWGDIIPGVLTGVGLGLAAVGGVAILALSISAPVLIAFLLAILMTVIILIARQAAIVILVVLAPLAFVAYLLPNTEQLFKKWLKTFWALLLVYPVVALLYGGGALAARIIHNASNQGDFWLSITALGVSAIPLIMTPALLKGSMSATGALGAKLQGWGNKANAGVGRNIREKSRFGEASQGIKNKFALNGATRRANSRFSRAIDRGWVGKKLGLDRGSYAATEAVQKEATADAARTIKYEYDSDYVKALSSSNENVQAIAAGELVNRGEFGAKSAYDYLKNGGSITSVEMADALTKMKGAHAGLGEVGTAALKHFQSGNKTPFSASDAELVTNTETGLAKLGNEALAKQSAAAIVEGRAAISASKASEMLADQRLRNSMTADTERAFTNIASGIPANAGAAGNQPAQNQARAGQTPAGTGGTPQQPTATPNLNNRQAQAQARVNAAAQGTAGTSPFFVAGNGTTASSAAMATGSVKQANASQGSSGSDSRVFVVDRSGDTTEAPVAPPAEPTTIPTVEDSGRQTPGTIGRDDVQDYHDRMSR